MPRTLSTSFRAALERPQSGDFPVYFVTITHPSLTQALRFVSDPIDFILDSETYLGCSFDLTILSDDERPPRGNLSIANVDRRIGLAIQALQAAPDVEIALYHSGDFNLIVTPRAPIGTPALQYEALHLSFRNIQIDDIQVSGDLISWDYSQEPWPQIRATAGRTPGLFR